MNSYEVTIIIFVLILNLLWYWNKYTLKQNKYPISWFFNHFGDVYNMFKLARKTENIELRKKYLVRAWAMPIGMFVLIIIFIFIALTHLLSIR